MKKALLLCAAALFSLAASAGDGLVPVGANVIVLPSSYWDGDIEWKAWTWVYNKGERYGDYGESNANYNVLCGEPAFDDEGREWFDPDYDMSPKEDDMNWDVYDEETGEFLPIVWEQHTSPYSTDESFNGKTSYQWTTGEIMADIYVRRTFTTDQLLSGPVYLACGHDDAPAEYYINGVQVFSVTDGWNNAEYILLTDEQKALIKLNGEENVIAFHVHQNWGGAFADCGLYTKMEGGLDMGFTTPWEGKVLFNNFGGFDHEENNQPVESLLHPWSKLYKAQEGDVYSFLLEGSSNVDDIDEDNEEIGHWREQLHFKTPIRIDADHDYNFKVWLGADKAIGNVTVKLTDNNDDEAVLAEKEIEIPAPVEGEEYEGVLVEFERFSGEAPATYRADPETGEDVKVEHPVNDFKIAFDFGGGQDSTTVTIKDISLVDVDFENEEGETEEKELWVGTHYFNFIDMHKRVVKYMVWDYNDVGESYQREATEDELEWADEVFSYEGVVAPEITGRTESLAWTEVDFDDSMWDDQMMPVGNAGYMAEVQSIWPGGDNSNYWIRRNFELDKVNERLSYELNVCHDDTYETYVNGHLLQKNTGWTNGKNPVQVHIPARYLNVGKNVIATYIQQNWGGKFYDCGINVSEVNYEESVKAFNDAIAYAQSDVVLTNRMKKDIKTLIDEAKSFFNENKNDPAEIKNYAKEFKAAVNVIFGYSSTVKTLKDTWDICRKMEDKGWWGTALSDATAALDTCATASDLNKYLNPLRDARKATAMERHYEKFVGCVPEAVTTDEIGIIDEYPDPMDDPRPKYYIFNVGAKNFLGGGESWGAHQAIEYISNPMMLVQATQDVLDEDGYPIDVEDIEGGYFIETFRANGAMGVMDFLHWNGFVDVNMNCPWELIPVEGKENVYNIAQYGQASTAEEKTWAGVTYAPGCKRYLGLRNGDNGFAPSYYIVDTDMHDPNMETNQWMFISREELLGFIATASEDNPVDLSFLIKNPGYDQRLSIDDWIFFNGSVWGRGGDHANFVLESYNTNEFSNYQEIWPAEYDMALPAGTYVLGVQGYYRDGIEKAHVDKVLNGQPIYQKSIVFAASEFNGDNLDPTAWDTTPLMPIHIEANKVPGIGYGEAQGLRTPGTYSGQPMSACEQAANEFFPCGLYWNQLVFTISEDDPGHIAFGIYKPYDEELTDKGDWIVMDNWRIKYYGQGEIDPDAINGVVTDEINKTTSASKGIYNMLGQRMSKAQKGVNIIGGKKIVKK